MGKSPSTRIIWPQSKFQQTKGKKKIHFDYDKNQNLSHTQKQSSFLSIRHNGLVEPTTNHSVGAKRQEDFQRGRKMALSSHKDFPMGAPSVSQQLQNAT